MKKLFFIFASMFFMFACTQEEENLPTNEKSNAQTSELSTAEAQVRFAKLLSQAASSSVEVRRFLKNEATKQFDNDYDVFYPFVKNKIVSDNKTFREILLSYCDDEKELVDVEQSQLLLNILIPDLTLFWDFNAEKWDTNNQEVVVMCRDDESDTMYENGENIGQAEKGDIPGFPCLVIKDNERLRVKSANTRSSEATYEFTSDAFDGSKNVQTRHFDTDIDLETPEDLNKYVNGSELMSSVKEAWSEFKNIPTAYQRDYIYYNINKENKPGILNRNIREKLYRFRINANAFSRIADADGDPQIKNFTKEKGQLSNEQILERLWKDGAFEFRLTSYIAGENSTASMKHELEFTVRLKEAFSINKIHLHHKNSTGFRHSKNFYSVNLNNLSSKWIYPEKLEKKSDNQVFLLPWDLYNKSLTIFLFAEESDSKQTKEETKTIVSEFTNKADFSLDGGGSIGDIKLTAKLGYGFSHTTTITNSTKVMTELGSDNLGTLAFSFYDPIIRSESNGTYKLYNASSGDMEMTILPMNLLSK